MLAGQAPISDHLSLTPLMAAYENLSHKQPAQVTDTFFAFRGCPLKRTSTVFILEEIRYIKGAAAGTIKAMMLKIFRCFTTFLL